MDRSFIVGVISIIKSAFTGEKVFLPEDFDFERAYKLAKHHSVVPLIYYGIVNSNINLEPTLSEKFFTVTCRYVAIGEKQKFECANLIREFEENEIDFMLLKGSVIRSLYPKVEMRAMGDADILIKTEQYNKIIPILERNGFDFIKESSNELVWNKATLHLELHRFLLSPDHEDYFKYFGNGWKFAKLKEGTEYEYEMSDEDFFVFMFAHLTKHYRSSGVGIKHITDILVFLNAKPKLNREYVKQELDKLGMLTFYENVIRMVDVWFNNSEFDDITYLITQKIFASGAFGTSESSNKSKVIKEIKSGKVRKTRAHRFINTVFLPYKNMCLLFPFLKKTPVMLPFMWIYRGLYTLFCKKGTLTKHYKAIKQLSPEQLTQYENDLNAVGLDYKFEE